MRHSYLVVTALLLLAAADASAQEWRVFSRGAAFLTHVTQTGPAEPESRTFSTNWLELGVRRSFGDASIELRGRGSAEPWTIPAEGYPQLLQYVSPESGGPLIDRMRANDALQEALVEVKWRALRVDVAPVAEPPLGATHFSRRASSIDFAEAPFAYDVQESFHLATRMLGGAFDTRFVTVEGAVFHAAVSSGRHSSLPSGGGTDSWSGRVTFRPMPRLAIQASRGELGDEKRQVTSASLEYEGPVLAASAIWTRREAAEALRPLVEPLESLTAEVAFRARSNVFQLRGEWVDRPAATIYPTQRRTAHLTVGDVFDFVHVRNVRAGLGVNIDYQTQTRELTRYGHKPQSIYAFFRVRTE